MKPDSVQGEDTKSSSFLDRLERGLSSSAPTATTKKKGKVSEHTCAELRTLISCAVWSRHFQSCKRSLGRRIALAHKFRHFPTWYVAPSASIAHPCMHAHTTQSLTPLLHRPLQICCKIRFLSQRWQQQHTTRILFSAFLQPFHISFCGAVTENYK